jgi:hypothetical protein
MRDGERCSFSLSLSPPPQRNCLPDALISLSDLLLTPYKSQKLWAAPLFFLPLINPFFRLLHLLRRSGAAAAASI